MSTGRPPRLVTVAATEWLTPGMVRVVLEGDSLEGFEPVHADSYVKFHFAAAGASYAAPFDPGEMRRSLPREQWPRVRSLTVRAWEPRTRRLTLDFVVHGDVGLAGPWAAGASVGDVAQLAGPGGAYSPDPTADAHLLVGDESALPAVAVALERLPAGRPTDAVLQVRDADHEVSLESRADLRLEWVHGGEEKSAVLGAVRALEPRPGRIHGFLHGEASMVRAVRRHLLLDRRLDAAMLSASGYWKRDRDDEGWRAEKPEWKALVEADVARDTGR